MQLVKDVNDIGLLVREKRKELGLKQAEAAGLLGVGVRFLSELERGKESISLGKTLLVLQRLGLQCVIADRMSLRKAANESDR